MMTREEILAAADLPRELVHVPEWGGNILVRMMTAGERQDYLRLAVRTGANGRAEADPNAEAALVAMTACDETGQRLFGNDDVAALAGKSATSIKRVAAAAAELNAITGPARKALAKN